MHGILMQHIAAQLGCPCLKFATALLLLQWIGWSRLDTHVSWSQSQSVTLQIEVQPRQGDIPFAV